MNLWDEKVTLAELLLGNYRHPLAIRVETDLLGKFILIEYLPDARLVNPPLHVHYKNVDQPDLSLLTWYLVFWLVNEFVEAATAENDCFEDLPGILMLNKLFGFENWNWLVAAQVNRLNIDFSICQAPCRFDTNVGAPSHHFKSIQTPNETVAVEELV